MRAGNRSGARLDARVERPCYGARTALGPSARSVERGETLAGRRRARNPVTLHGRYLAMVKTVGVTAKNTLSVQLTRTRALFDATVGNVTLAAPLLGTLASSGSGR